MSKTERALTSSGTGDALDDLFVDESFDTAFDEAIEDADRELGVDGHRDDPSDGSESEDVVGPVDELHAVETETDDAVFPIDERPVADDDGDEPATLHASDDALEPAVMPDEIESDDVDDDDRPTAELAAPSVTPEIDDEHDDALPTIVQAIPDDDELAARVSPVGDPDLDESGDEEDSGADVSDQILEELRRADIDGPVVAFAPQDETTAARRRPKQSADYDPAPVPIPAKVPRVLGRKARVRKVTRVVRHVDPWSVFKIALVANLVLYVIVLTASVLLWNVANATGTVDNVERFLESFGWNSFEFDGGELYHAGWIAGLFAVIGLTGLAVLGATLFNLITDLVGGVRFTVLEEEVVETRTSPMRRFVVRRAEPEVPAVIRDSSGAMYREAVVDDTGANVRPTR